MRPLLNGGTLPDNESALPETPSTIARGWSPRYPSRMAQPVPNPPPGFEALSVDEKIDYLESLWDHVVDQANLPIPDWQRELLEERLEAYRANPTAGRPWSEVRGELERKFSAPR
jgi:putative addiction module component (TIGR02574 family)